MKMRMEAISGVQRAIRDDDGRGVIVGVD